MENAIRALLIAAGVFFAILIISVAIFAYDRISNYYSQKETDRIAEQLDSFNKKYSGYNRDDVRGSDLLSLINRILDFNAQNSYSQVEPIGIQIIIPKDKLQDFYYNYSENKSIKWLTKSGESFPYTQQDFNEESKLTGMLKIVSDIEAKYPRGLATKLANNLSKLFNMDPNSINNRTTYLKQLKVDDTGSTLTNDILKYYQYMQFKRAHFDCIELKYTEDGRVLGFKFIFNGTFE